MIEQQQRPRSAECDWLPCSISFDGVAPVHAYFQKATLDGTTKVAHFRGRGLMAKTAPRDESMQGIVVQESNGMVETKFDRVNEWNHDSTAEVLIGSSSVTERLRGMQAVSRAAHDPLPLLPEQDEN